MAGSSSAIRMRFERRGRGVPARSRRGSGAGRRGHRPQYKARPTAARVVGVGCGRWPSCLLRSRYPEFQSPRAGGTDSLASSATRTPPPTPRRPHPTRSLWRRACARARSTRSSGQDHLLAPGRVLRRVLEADRVPSMILWGPPGSGKTTLAEVIARATSSTFVALSAVSAGVADLRRVIDQARRSAERTILFIDEIHRFNKAQQDAVLPYVEDGTVTLIGATTENPLVRGQRGAALAQSRLSARRPLRRPDRRARRARPGHARAGPGRPERWSSTPDALALLVDRANGDARVGAERARAGRRGDATRRRWRPPGQPRDRRGRPAAARLAVRPRRRPALRRHLGVHQVGPRLGPGRGRSTGWRACSNRAKT